MELLLILLVVCALILLSIAILVVVVLFVLLVLTHITSMQLHNAFNIVPKDGMVTKTHQFLVKRVMLLANHVLMDIKIPLVLFALKVFT